MFYKFKLTGCREKFAICKAKNEKEALRQLGKLECYATLSSVYETAAEAFSSTDQMKSN